LRRHAVTILTAVACLMVALSVFGAVPRQEVPPFAVVYSGSVTIEGEPAPEGLLIMACVAGCDTGWETSEEEGQAVKTSAESTYFVIIGPPDVSFLDEEITFWIVTDFGERIKAVETEIYDPNNPNKDISRTLDLTFDEPLPVAPTATPPPTVTSTVAPTATLVLPIPGDAGVPALFRWAMIAGAAALAVGGVTFFWFHRRRTI